MVSEFVVVWVELNWLRDVAGSAFFCERGGESITMLTIIAAAVACGLIGGGTGYLYRKKIAEGKIGQG